MTSLYKAVRVVQAGFLVAAAVTGLSWFETGSTRMEDVAHEELSVEVLAPVENPRGPWQEGVVFSGEHEGIPPDVAPNMTVQARHTVTGLAVEEAEWSGAVVFEATGEGGDAWWSERRTAPVEADGSEARVQVHLPSVVEEAQAMDETADVPSRLSISIELVQEAVLEEKGLSVQVASVDVVPREGFVATELRGDSSTFTEPVEEGTDWVPLALVGGVLVAQGPAWGLRRGRAPWENRWGVSASMVGGLEVPEGAPEAPTEELFSLARDRGGSLLVDRERGIAVVPGDPPVWGVVEAGAGEEKPGLGAGDDESHVG